MVVQAIKSATSVESRKSPYKALSSTSASMSSCLSASVFNLGNEGNLETEEDLDINSGASLFATSSRIANALDVNIDDEDDPFDTKSSVSSESLFAGIVLESEIKPILSTRKPSGKARRIKFYRNGDRFYPGVTIPVSNGRYRTFESLFQDLTRLLVEANIKIAGALRTIYTMLGEKVTSLRDLQDGQSYVCACNNENFIQMEYNTTSQPVFSRSRSTKSLNRLPKLPSSLSKSNLTKSPCASNTKPVFDLASPVDSKPSEHDSTFPPRFITIIRNSYRPRKIMRLLLNKRSSPSFDHILATITQMVKLDTGYVRKVYNSDGMLVTRLSDFFGPNDVFFVYGTERASPDDFRLDSVENKTFLALRKNFNEGLKADTKKSVKSKKSCDRFTSGEERLLRENDLNPVEFPLRIKGRYRLENVISKGKFALVLKCVDRQSGVPFALKVIEKSKYKAKDEWVSIDGEVDVMKKLSHPNIVSLMMDVNQMNHMYLVMEYVSGDNLCDALARAGTFEEDQARIMIRHLASALVFLHYINLVHRDVKLDNLLVEFDSEGNVVHLKLSDFSLTCEASNPLYAICGTSTYWAPEIQTGNGYGVKIDVWAAGVILYMLLCGFPPLVHDKSNEKYLRKGINAGTYEFPDFEWTNIGNEVRELITKMLKSDPASRFSSKDVLAHRWTCGVTAESPIDDFTEHETDDDN